MNSPATNLGRTPSLKKLFAVMAGFLTVLVILAELASATTNDQPAIAQEPSQASAPAPTPAPHETVAAAPVSENVSEPAHPNSISYGANEVIKMYKGGVKADVLLTYIETANVSYQLSSKEILYLSQSGVPSEIVNAMIRRDHQTGLAQQQVQAPSASAEPTTVSYSQPQQTTVVVQPAPSVKYTSPVYAAPAYPTSVSTSPNVTIIGSRYGSTFFNSCYSGPISPRSYYNFEFGNSCYTSPYYSYGFGYRNRLAYGGFNGAYGRFGHGRRFGRY